MRDVQAVTSSEHEIIQKLGEISTHISSHDQVPWHAWRLLSAVPPQRLECVEWCSPLEGQVPILCHSPRWVSLAGLSGYVMCHSNWSRLSVPIVVAHYLVPRPPVCQILQSLERTNLRLQTQQQMQQMQQMQFAAGSAWPGLLADNQAMPMPQQQMTKLRPMQMLARPPSVNVWT